MIASASERRTATRIPVRIRIKYQTPDKFFQDYIQNISAGGILIETPSPLRVGTRLKVQFCLPDLEDPIITDGVVVHQIDVGTVKPQYGGMGIKFSELDRKNRNFLETYVQRIV